MLFRSDYFVGDEGLLVHNDVEPQTWYSYSDFAANSVTGDGIAGHEIWQFANQQAQGLSTQRLVGNASRGNPVLALDDATHASVTTAQRAIDAVSQTSEENILSNAAILRNQGIPENKIQQGVDWALKHAKNCR